MIGTQPATWRIVYKRSITGKLLIGFKEKDYLNFLDDIQNLYESYVAVLECKELQGSPWEFVAYVLVKNFVKGEIVLIDGYGEKFVTTTFTKDALKELLMTKPTYNDLKRNY